MVGKEVRSIRGAFGNDVRLPCWEIMAATALDRVPCRSSNGFLGLQAW